MTFFATLGCGNGYQTRANALLRDVMLKEIKQGELVLRTRNTPTSANFRHI